MSCYDIDDDTYFMDFWWTDDESLMVWDEPEGHRDSSSEIE